MQYSLIYLILSLALSDCSVTSPTVACQKVHFSFRIACKLVQLESERYDQVIIYLYYVSQVLRVL